ncbi:MAG: hypothetical protein ACRBBR_00590 [Cellvibrionaceae bacterium]
MDIPQTQKSLLEPLLNPPLFETQWLRWAAATFIFYFTFGNGISLSKSVSHRFMGTLKEHNTGLGSLIIDWLLYGILAEFILVLSLIAGLILAYGLVRVKTGWFKRMAIICFIMAGCRLILPAIHTIYLFLKHSGHIPITSLFSDLLVQVIMGGLAALLPLYIGYLLLRHVRQTSTEACLNNRTN